VIDEDLLAQIRALEVQLAVLKACCRERAAGTLKTFADLYGLLRDKVQSSEEEIEASLFRFRCEKIGNG